MTVWFCVTTVLVAGGCTERPAPEPIDHAGIPFREMPVEALPGLNIPRMSHSLFAVGDELVVIGGHTTGFIPTKTAEYLNGGKWRLVETHYTHDDGFAVVSNGLPMVGGGYEGDFGIGQSWGVELYDPSTHSISHLPILDRKRTHASAVELEDGQVLVSGNWYAPDDLELYTPGEGFHFVKKASQPRSFPYLLKSAPDNALVFSIRDNYNNLQLPLVIDRLKGDPFTVPLLEEWRPVMIHHNIQPGTFDVGNCSYLLLAVNGREEYAPLLVSGEEFSLLETEHPFPSEGPWGKIDYDCQFFTDKEREVAWLLGTDFEDRVYLLKLGYGVALRGGEAPVSLYYSQPLEQLWWAPPGTERKPGQMPSPRGLLLHDGRMALIGGTGGYSNYDPTPVACILSPDGPVRADGFPGWVIALGLAVLGAIAAFQWRRAARKATLPTAEAGILPEEDLLSRLIDLMENKQFFRRKDAKLSLAASELGTNVTYISAIVNGTLGTNFPTFLNGYRIRYAQQLMQEHPEMPIHLVADESGFPNETTFLRNFKAQTGLTPSEWKAGI